MAMADLKKVKAAAAGRTKKGGKNWKMQYMFWIGGSVGSIVLACLMLLVNPDKGPFGTPVNDQSMITHVNRNAKSWGAGSSSFFDGWTIGDVKLLEGVGVSQMGGAVPQCVVPEAPVPDSFDAREKWAPCFSSPIFNMGNCSASWAIATASALSNRFCIADPEKHKDLTLSPQQLLSCDNANRGCNGGDIDSAYNYIQREGLVSETCFPYQADGMVSCQSKCTSETGLKSASHCQLNGEAAIKREIFLNGPVVAPIFLMDDFLVYAGGLYQETPTATQLTGSGRNRLVQAVKILGWGTMNRKKYWIIENAWGDDWGEQGYARVLRGGDPEKREGVILETFAVAGTPASSKVEDADSEFEADVDLEDIDLDDDSASKSGSADLDDDDD
mmetsp:Transcript_86721/g.250461  ORF Transcript_86721/g.250461 Transcript_86721/m.250461 type:complete len:387 (-) Transcript_86721:77-1237(-)